LPAAGAEVGLEVEWDLQQRESEDVPRPGEIGFLWGLLRQAQKLVSSKSIQGIAWHKDLKNAKRILRGQEEGE
jgi:hypothetical protein